MGDGRAECDATILKLWTLLYLCVCVCRVVDEVAGCRFRLTNRRSVVGRPSHSVSSCLPALSCPPSLYICRAVRTWMQTSALDSSGVESAFQRILTEIYRLMSRKTIAANNTTGPNLSQVRKNRVLFCFFVALCCDCWLSVSDYGAHHTFPVRGA